MSGQGATTRASINRTTADYFDTTGIEILHGRAYTAAEIAADAPVALVSTRIAQAIWRDPAGAIGETLVLGTRPPVRLLVVGVVEDVVATDLLELAHPIGTVYRPASFQFLSEASLVIKTEDGADRSIGSVSRALPSFDPARVRPQALSVQAAVDRQLSVAQMPSRLASLTAVAIGALTIIGLNALVTLNLQQRRRAIGIRLMLGAPSAAVLRYSVRAMTTPVVAGVAGGAISAYALVRTMSALLFGIGDFDVPALTISAVGLAAVVGLSMALPLFRVLRVDPRDIVQRSI